MYFQEFKGIDSCVVGLARMLLKEGKKRQTRGLDSIELDHPIVIKITNPLARIVTIPERNWNHVLPFAESLWLASGRNDMELIGAYLKRMYDYSDDQETMRAAYGPRLRRFTGIRNDYRSNFFTKTIDKTSAQSIEVDQFQFIQKIFRRDSFTRQAVISITDPAKDLFITTGELKETKDFPCTTTLQFIRRDKYLDLITNMRSNDYLWGATGVNIFNFTFILEYFSQILGLEVGHYYHIVNNLHYYQRFHSKIQVLADVTSCSDEAFMYRKNFCDLKDFDQKISLLEQYEKGLRDGLTNTLNDFGDDFFNDWAKVFYQFHTSKPVNFVNPVLNNIGTQKKISSTLKNEKYVPIR